MPFDDANHTSLLEGFAAGDRKSLARLISMVENADPGADGLLARLYARTGHAYRIGLTGPPGVGKSTLIDSLIATLRQRGVKVGVVAVDPSSPFTGGALLGDRVRITSKSPDPGFFFRSMATRGSRGGLAATASEVSDLYDAWGMDFVLLETVGVGQIELDVVAASDCTVVVLVPESGDEVQAMKAGLMEIGDVFVLNKSDLAGSGRAAADLRSALNLRESNDSSWRPPLVSTVAREAKGVDELLKAIDSFREHQRKTGEGRERLRRVVREKIREAVERSLHRSLWHGGGSGLLEAAVEEVLERKRNPYELAAEIVRRLHPTDTREVSGGSA
jgi:LAO/AO transport system kinase